MQKLYVRNKIHINIKEQELIKNFKVLIAGCGIGSYIAETLLRLGFESLTIVDGDKVELSNLNRQNYVQSDIGKLKVHALQRRLLEINPNAQINIKSIYIDNENLHSIEKDFGAAINALDFTSDIPFQFDFYMVENKIPVIHPFNLGWAGYVTIINHKSSNFKNLILTNKKTELDLGKFIVSSLEENDIECIWLKEFLRDYKCLANYESVPQLSIGVNILAGMVTNLIFDIATGKQTKFFPEYYYLTIK